MKLWCVAIDSSSFLRPCDLKFKMGCNEKIRFEQPGA